MILKLFFACAVRFECLVSSLWWWISEKIEEKTEDTFIYILFTKSCNTYTHLLLGKYFKYIRPPPPASSSSQSFPAPSPLVEDSKCCQHYQHLLFHTNTGQYIMGTLLFFTERNLLDSVPLHPYSFSFDVPPVALVLKLCWFLFE